MAALLPSALRSAPVDHPSKAKQENFKKNWKYKTLCKSIFDGVVCSWNVRCANIHPEHTLNSWKFCPLDQFKRFMEPHDDAEGCSRRPSCSLPHPNDFFMILNENMLGAYGC